MSTVPAKSAWVGGPEGATVPPTVRLTSEAFGRDAPTPEVVGGYRLGDVRHVFASPKLAARTLGFEATVPFAAGMAEFATAPARP